MWWVVSSMIALAFGGYVAARLAGLASRWDGALHGLIIWGIATLVVFDPLMLAFSSIVGGGFSLLGNVVSAAGSGLKTAAQPIAQAAGVTPDTLRQEAQTYLQPANPDLATMSPQDAQKQVATDLATYTKGGPDAAAAKERVINIMAAQLHLSHDEAAKRFDNAQAQVKQARTGRCRRRRLRRMQVPPRLRRAPSPSSETCFLTRSPPRSAVPWRRRAVCA